MGAAVYIANTPGGGGGHMTSANPVPGGAIYVGFSSGNVWSEGAQSPLDHVGCFQP